MSFYLFLIKVLQFYQNEIFNNCEFDKIFNSLLLLLNFWKLSTFNILNISFTSNSQTKQSGYAIKSKLKASLSYKNKFLS